MQQFILCNISLGIYITDCLPASMTCNIGMLSDFFNSKNDNQSDWFLEDYNNTMVNKIKNTFEDFGKYYEF